MTIDGLSVVSESFCLTQDGVVDWCRNEAASFQLILAYELKGRRWADAIAESKSAVQCAAHDDTQVGGASPPLLFCTSTHPSRECVEVGCSHWVCIMDQVLVANDTHVESDAIELGHSDTEFHDSVLEGSVFANLLSAKSESSYLVGNLEGTCTAVSFVRHHDATENGQHLSVCPVTQHSIWVERRRNR